MLINRTFRIFVSSTFSDLKAERNALQSAVFPRLRALAEAHGCRFQAIDLRWGVSEEAALDHKTMDICLDEIARCRSISPRPNFIILLGQRYGWRPLPSAIPASEFQLLLPHLTEEERLLAVWDEKAPNGAQGWYRLDENAVPAQVVLQPRLLGSPYADYSLWHSQIEAPLVAALERAAVRAVLSNAALEKYTLSATEQEIVKGALQVEDAQEHVFVYSREVNGTSPVEQAWETVDSEADSNQRLARLKQRLKNLLPANVREYHTNWSAEGPDLDHIPLLCEQVYTDLAAVIQAEIEKFDSVDELDVENSAHASFQQARNRGFFGRVEHLDRIQKYLTSQEPYPLVVEGQSGSGKTSLMARAALTAQQCFPQAVVMARFTGATPRSTDKRIFLEDLCRSIQKAYGRQGRSMPESFKELVLEFKNSLTSATEERPLILFIDALDQLATADLDFPFEWIPPDLHAHVRIIVSILTDQSQGLLEQLEGALRLQVGGFSQEDGARLLNGWLKEIDRRLTAEQEQIILSQFARAGGLPLFLKLAFEEAQLWHSYDDLPTQPDGTPGISGDSPGIIRQLLRRLQQENNHGSVFVQHALGTLAASRNGLSEAEIVDVLWQYPAVRADFFRRSPASPGDINALPVVVWSRLYSDLQPYLLWRQADGAELLGFYHRQLQEEVVKLFAGSDQAHNWHRHLADYFGNPDRPYWIDLSHCIPDQRKTSELPYQQARSADFPALLTTLTSINYLHARLTGTRVDTVIDEYDQAISALEGLNRHFLQRYNPTHAPSSQAAVIPHTQLEQLSAGIEGLEVIRDCLRLSAHMLAKDANLLPTQLVGRLKDHPNRLVRRLVSSAITYYGLPWLRPLNQCLVPPGGAQERTFTGHSGEIDSISVLPGAQRFISGSRDGTLKLWSIEKGVEIRSTKPQGYVLRSVLALPDGETCLSAGDDSHIHLWNLRTGSEIRCYKGHKGWVMGLAALPGGLQFLSTSYDATIKLWDMQSGELIRTFNGHSAPVNAAAISPDGRRFISASDDETLMVWDLRTGRVEHTLYGHRKEVTCVAYLPDGLRAVSGGYEGSVFLWDLTSGTKIKVIEGRGGGYILSLAILADGKQALVAFSNYQIEILHLDTDEDPTVIEGHNSAVTALALLPGGKQVLTASADHAIKLWQLEQKSEQGFRAHRTQVSILRTDPGGNLLISGSFRHAVVWDLKDVIPISFLFSQSDNPKILRDICVHPDGQNVLISDNGGSINCWNMDTSDLVRTFTPGDWQEAITLLPNGRYALSRGRKRFWVWDLVNWSEALTFTVEDLKASHEIYLPEGRISLRGTTYQHLLWRTDQGTEVISMGLEEGPLAILPGREQALICSTAHWSNTFQLVDLRSDRLLRTFTGHTGKINTIALLPGGKAAISASSDQTMRFWDLETGQCLCTYIADGRLMSCAAVSSTLFAAGDWFGAVHFVRLETGCPQKALLEQLERSSRPT